MSQSAAFPFQSQFVTVNGHKIHYAEEGHGDPILFIHGNPTSSYLWRNVLPPVARETGRRGVAIDLFGFGKSDKPALEYSVELHYRILEDVIECGISITGDRLKRGQPPSHDAIAWLPRPFRPVEPRV